MTDIRQWEVVNQLGEGGSWLTGMPWWTQTHTQSTPQTRRMEHPDASLALAVGVGSEHR